MKQNRVPLRAGDASRAADNQQSEPMAVDTTSVGVTDGVRGCLSDLDGVITKTAAQSGGRFVPFDAVVDYDAYVDRKSRADSTRSFPASRGVSLPEGSAEDASETVNGLGNRKNDIVRRHNRKDGVEVYQGSLRFVRAVRSCGLRCAVVSSSTNCQGVFIAAGRADLFDQRIEGLTAKRKPLTEKPAPGIFLAGAHWPCPR
ncbi:hypothetical protein [Cryobacterium sp. Y50]|uniref:hypothetical protein n=1 Tax=Cryobacterium sp. Y50 TaxID=2048286 RepID=UPI000CE3351D|nr:hypothetical protein [Cryobacterium sp. Y50]